ncbi:OLC1v1025953C1 [Oldenlandia corymbosa var. corymbosa]|uniref:OLC1v1025953C1 n=1 Tax=Oldenlandia corymbosa var. corymbosa TaxID=529605 RepID=A0AAV1C6A9_OLDCO|nr:OLC1v1025953C1 [Oldenlandia corymbosa var. corymbosa]
MSGLYSSPSHSLLEEALSFGEADDAVYLSSSRPKAALPSGGGGGGGGSGTVVLIEDCVETNGGFILHHLIKRALSPNRPSDVVVFVSFAHPFSHYDRILRKMGCNLSGHRENKRFIYHDMLSMNSPGSVRDGIEATDDLLMTLYGKIQKAVELYSSPEGSKHVTIMIDDISLMEVAVNGLSNHVVDFLHYCYSLTTQFGCSMIILNHEDIYSSLEQLSPLLHLEYLANVVIKAEPLATGLATDVHGQLTVFNKGICRRNGKSKSKIRNFQFRVKENKVEFFYPGSQT